MKGKEHTISLSYHLRERTLKSTPVEKFRVYKTNCQFQRPCSGTVTHENVLSLQISWSTHIKYIH